ncbi:MAG: bifunctional glutamate N-acetyltransferase/amino-acid acetyltransferase ArgJ [Candidatus Omnitrophica bacterium]|nr:bifunctional glutamate N-acetyltransferase/amino-acid acetyltransferase ArgJ [Candidatus Omnitrophota bacterium]
MKEFKNISITAPLGFKTNALHCGIKKKNADLSLIYSVVKAKAAGVFTSNKVKAAPVVIDQEQLRNGCAQAIIVNSGNANCCTGKKGKLDALSVVNALGKYLEIDNSDVLVASTGIIGKFLPVEKIISAIGSLAEGLSFDKSDLTAAALMTTDTFPKQAAVEINLKGKRVIIGAVAKGAGMICPNMATMLCFITTDANISSPLLKKSLRQAVDGSFNCISVDGEMSTNDSVIILANGLSSNSAIKDNSREFKIFTQALKYVCVKLAKMIVQDAEGATKFIEVRVEKAKTKEQAKAAAYQIANSLLVKTMIAGENPNWGRIPACLGASGVDFKDEKIEVFLQKKSVYRNGLPMIKDIKVLIKLLEKKDIEIVARLNSGKFEYTVWTSDLTAEYVRINTEYT